MLKRTLAIIATGFIHATLSFGGDINVLVIGSTQTVYPYSSSSSSAYNPTKVCTDLTTMLSNNGYNSPNVVFENRGDQNGGSTNGGNLATWFSYPYPADVETTTRWPNLRGEAGTIWDYIVLIPDTFTFDPIPGPQTVTVVNGMAAANVTISEAAQQMKLKVSE